jgi:hypothetical protein
LCKTNYFCSVEPKKTQIWKTYTLPLLNNTYGSNLVGVISIPYVMDLIKIVLIMILMDGGSSHLKPLKVHNRYDTNQYENYFQPYEEIMEPMLFTNVDDYEI